MKSRADVIEQIQPRPLRLGQSDCERIRDGFIGQPVNTLSNVGYVISGAELVARGLTGQVKRPRLTMAFGLALTALGLPPLAERFRELGLRQFQLCQQLPTRLISLL